MKRQTDVLIAGAGPVGLLLAAELSRDGIDVLVIEKHLERTFFSKALGVTARTLEIFEDLGIADAAIDNGVWIGGVTVFQNGVQVQAMDVPDQALPYGALALPQFETERLLETCLHRHGGKVHYGHSLQSFTENADGVLAAIAGADGKTMDVTCKYLIGCDGSRSTVRSGLGLSFEGGKYPQTFVLADLELDWDLARGRMYRFNTSRESGPGNSLVAMPVHGTFNRYRLSTVLDHATEDETTAVPAPDMEQIKTIMLPLLPPGAKLSALKWSSLYRVSHRIVPQYGIGRVYLAGDAAHIHPPVGGQGMNTGLQDAHNLAWKLTLSCRGLASLALLASYSAERHPVGLDVVEQTSRAMNEVMAQKINMPGLRETQLLVGYRDSAIVQEDRPSPDPAMPAPGDNAPDSGQLRQPFVLHAARLRDRIGKGRHLLVGFVAKEEIEPLADMLDDLKAMLGQAIAGVAIAAPGEPPAYQERLPVLTDAAGEFAAAYGAQPGMVWLIRPDGHIGFAGAISSRGALAAHVTKICAGPA